MLWAVDIEQEDGYTTMRSIFVCPVTDMPDRFVDFNVRIAADADGGCSS